MGPYWILEYLIAGLSILPIGEAPPRLARQCSQEIRISESDGRAWLTLFVTKRHRPLAVELTIGNDRGYSGTWRVDSIGMSHERAMRRFDYDFVLPAGEHAFPVTVDISLDGEQVATHAFPAPSGGSISLPDTTVRPFLTIANERIAIPNVFGHDRMTVVGTDASGAVIAAADIDLLDWDALSGQVDEAWPGLIEAQRMRRCAKVMFISAE